MHKNQPAETIAKSFSKHTYRLSESEKVQKSVSRQDFLCIEHLEGVSKKVDSCDFGNEIFCLKMTSIGVFLCEESVSRILEP